MKRNAILRGALCAAALALGLPAMAQVDLAGSSWTLSGSSRAKLTGSPNVGGPASATLSFAAEAASCLLAVSVSSPQLPVDDSCGGNLCLPCSWSANGARGFTLQFDDAAAAESLRALLASTVPPELAAAVTVELQTDKGQGTIKKNGRMQLGTLIKADISVPQLTLQRSVMLRLTFYGTEAQ